MESADKPSPPSCDPSTTASVAPTSPTTALALPESSPDSGTPFPLPAGLTFRSNREGTFPGHPGPLMAGTFIRGVEVWPTLKAWMIHFCGTPTQKWLDALGSMGPLDWARLEEPPGRLIEDPRRTIVFSMMFTWRPFTVETASARLMTDPDFLAQWGGSALPE